MVRSLRSDDFRHIDHGRYANAKPLLQEALRIRRKVFGPENPLTAQSLNNLAWLYQPMGEYAKAEPLFQLSANLQALFEAVWAPIGQALPSQTKRIIISPDGQEVK